jgi:hypothetical protein
MSGSPAPEQLLESPGAGAPRRVRHWSAGGGTRLRGAAVWAAYGAVEVLLVIILRRVFFGWAFVAPDVRYTLFLLFFYPVVGALLGRFATAGLAIAFVANAAAIYGGATLAVPLVTALIAVVMFRNSAWLASLVLLAPLCAAREFGFFSTFRTKALLAGAAIAAVMLLHLISRKMRWSVPPMATIAVFAVTMLSAMLLSAGRRVTSRQSSRRRTLHLRTSSFS